MQCDHPLSYPHPHGVSFSKRIPVRHIFPVDMFRSPVTLFLVNGLMLPRAPLHLSLVT